MIRFLDLTNQIDDNTQAFAFYDTVTGRIVDIGGEQVFGDRADFIEFYLDVYDDGERYQRLLNLIPDHIK